MNVLAHLFLPRASNNHKAGLLHFSSLLLVVLGFLVFQCFLQIASTKNAQVLGYAANISSSEVERLTNIQRERNGLPDLVDNPELDAGALAKGRDMLAKGYWAHVAPDGTQPWAFFIRSNYDYRFAGENLARDFPDAASAVNAWMASPTHRENVLSPNYKDIGIGVVEGNLNGVDTTIIVQFFGTRLGDAVSEKSSPKSVAIAMPVPTLTPVPVPTTTPAVIVTPAPVTAKPLIASATVTPFDVTRYLSLGVVGVLVLVVAVDGILVNKRRIFRVAGHFPAHIAFLGMILTILIIAKAGRII